MHVIFHLISSLLFGLGLSGAFLGEISLPVILAVTIGGIIMDLDHPLTWFFRYGSKIFSGGRDDFKTKTPRFYFTHTIEFLILTAGIIYFYSFFVYVWAGFVFHLSIDFLSHFFYHEKNYSWVKYYSTIALFSRNSSSSS